MDTTWRNRLIKKGSLNSPVVEQTPVIWEGKLLLVEVWQTHWDKPPTPQRQHYVRIRDEETNGIIGRCMDGYGLASAFVWNDMFYVFASLRREDPDSWNNVYMSQSTDLIQWTEPERVVEQDPEEHVFNQSVCYDGSRFVMAYETDTYAPFTIKFAQSNDLKDWRKIPDAIYGAERYTACPAIRFVGGYYYMLYLERPEPRCWFETWLTRSKDLVHWEDAPHKPVIAPDPDRNVHTDCPERAKECNASDPDLIEWQGKTRVYFTGGHQHWGGDLQYAEFDGTMQGFFESYYEDS